MWMSRTCRVGAEWPGVEWNYSRVEGNWQQKWGDNLGLSSCTVPQSAIAYMVAYFRRTELLPGVQEKSGILIRVRLEHVKDIKDIIDVNLWTKELGCN